MFINIFCGVFCDFDIYIETENAVAKLIFLVIKECLN